MSFIAINMKTEQFAEQSTILLLGYMVRKLSKKKKFTTCGWDKDDDRLHPAPSLLHTKDKVEDQVRDDLGGGRRKGEATQMSGEFMER